MSLFFGVHVFFAFMIFGPLMMFFGMMFRRGYSGINLASGTTAGDMFNATGIVFVAACLLYLVISFASYLLVKFESP